MIEQLLRPRGALYGLFVDLDARYRYLDKLVSESNQAMNTAETTLTSGSHN
jgi:hypothetical protein